MSYRLSVAVQLTDLIDDSLHSSGIGYVIRIDDDGALLKRFLEMGGVRIENVIGDVATAAGVQLLNWVPAGYVRARLSGSTLPLREPGRSDRPWTTAQSRTWR